MKLVDTSIFIYAAGRFHPLKESCVRLLRAMAEGETDYTIDTEVLQEILYVYTARGERDRGFEMFDSLTTLFPRPIPIGLEEVVVARQLMGVYRQLGPRDALHAAVVLNHGLEGLVSTDRIFDQVAGVLRLDPTSLYRV